MSIGQRLLSIRSATDVWVNANFKETQLKELVIGQPVDLYVDAYPGKVFHGRVRGFGTGTGAATSLLPVENATGNFVKIVQRLPVRIEILEDQSLEMPLFVGLSVVPYVRVYQTPTGPDAGMRCDFPPTRPRRRSLATSNSEGWPQPAILRTSMET